MQATEITRTGRPKSEQKGEAILRAASTLFLEKGYQGTSMDAVAQRAGVSKQTVYSHFSNKEELFKACIRAKVSGYGFEETTSAAGQGLRDALLHITHRFVDLLLDPEVIAMHRVVMAEAKSQPRIAALFFENGPRQTKSAVSAFLRDQVAKGSLHIPEERIFYASVQLLSTSVGMYQLELWLGLRESVGEDELNRHLERVVDDFLSLYQNNQV